MALYRRMVLCAESLTLDVRLQTALKTPSMKNQAQNYAHTHTLIPWLQAARVVAAVEARGVQLDTRKCFVRFGFGFNHSTADVDTLLQALETAR